MSYWIDELVGEDTYIRTVFNELHTPLYEFTYRNAELINTTYGVGLPSVSNTTTSTGPGMDQQDDEESSLDSMFESDIDKLHGQIRYIQCMPDEDLDIQK